MDVYTLDVLWMCTHYKDYGCVHTRCTYVLFVSCLLGVYPICHESRGRVDKSGTPQIDMIQMACIPNVLGRRIRIFTATIDTLTPLV